MGSSFDILLSHDSTGVYSRGDAGPARLFLTIGVCASAALTFGQQKEQNLPITVEEWTAKTVMLIGSYATKIANGDCQIRCQEELDRHGKNLVAEHYIGLGKRSQKVPCFQQQFNKRTGHDSDWGNQRMPPFLDFRIPGASMSDQKRQFRRLLA